ncbi:MAG: hypothetical protein OEX76_04995 [Candidatus Bathyarchaeota archaeon]|nr:hypothetical protein [Candidatus Bathyarchaeota archaeon]MDH5532695.1 hypothetical protein [Candidatus Bathyarchaeota archaeon]
MKLLKFFLCRVWRRQKKENIRCVANDNKRTEGNLILIDLRVDEHPRPVNELRRTFENFKRGTFGNNRPSSPRRGGIGGLREDNTCTAKTNKLANPRKEEEL